MRFYQMLQFLFFVSTAVQVSTLTHPKLLKGGKDLIKDEYLIIFNPASLSTVEAAKARISSKISASNTGSEESSLQDEPLPINEELPQIAPALLKSDSALKAVLDDPSVKAVEPNARVLSDCASQTTSAWNLQRVAARTGLNAQFQYNGNGSNVNVYVLDTGVETSHPEFGGRATFGTCVYVSLVPTADIGGHGTHVAGTVAGTLYGASKAVQVQSVRVFSDSGASSLTAIYYGLSWAFSHHINETSLLNPTVTNTSYYKLGLQPAGFVRAKSVVNMSLGSRGTSSTFDKVLEILYDYGMTLITSAGNNNDDACLYTPKSSRHTITVGCIDQKDELCSYSNHGTCVDILAPGDNIVSASHGFPLVSYIALNGTSMAAPLVSGIVANYLSITNPTPTPAQVKTWLQNTATTDSMVCHSGGHPRCLTPRKIVFSGCSTAPATHTYNTTTCSTCSSSATTQTLSTTTATTTRTHSTTTASTTHTFNTTSCPTCSSAANTGASLLLLVALKCLHI